MRRDGARRGAEGDGAAGRARLAPPGSNVRSTATRSDCSPLVEIEVEADRARPERARDKSRGRSEQPERGLEHVRQLTRRKRDFTRDLLTRHIARAILGTMEALRTFTAFAGQKLVASGDIRDVLRSVKARLDARGEEVPVLVFEDQTGAQVDFDLRGTADEAIERLSSHPLFEREAAPKRTGPGRPKLGVVSREVSLLPRHWEWLEAQRGGISVALRALVEEARKRGQLRQLARNAREAAGKFMWTMAGDLPDFEEASRALYAKDDAKLRALTKAWPKDIAAHVARLVAEAVRLEEQADLEEERANASKA